MRLCNESQRYDALKPDVSVVVVYCLPKSHPLFPVCSKPLEVVWRIHFVLIHRAYSAVVNLHDSVVVFFCMFCIWYPNWSEPVCKRHSMQAKKVSKQKQSESVHGCPR